MVTKCSFRHNLTGASKQKVYLTKTCQVICTYEGNAMQTTKYGIIWSEKVHFVTTLTVPLTKTGVLYPRVPDFLCRGITLAVFQLQGKMLCEMDKFTICVRTGASSFLTNLRT